MAVGESHGKLRGVFRNLSEDIEVIVSEPLHFDEFHAALLFFEFFYECSLRGFL